MAAAFAALVSLQNNLHLIYTHCRHSFSFEHQQTQSLWGSVRFLIHFMKSYENSYGPRKEAAEAIEIRIADAVQAAEDVIEYHVVDQIRGGKTRSRSCFLLDLQKAIEDMYYMRKKAINVLLRRAQSGREAERPTYSVAASTLSTPLTSNKTTAMVGFDDILLQLLDVMTGEPSSWRVIPIVGMGEIGKTTLATNAFQHPLIVQHFDVFLWATISQQYSIEKILTQLLSGLRKFTSKTVDDEREELHRSFCWVL